MLADQVFSTLSNVLLTILVARSSTAAQFGVFSIVLVVLPVAVGVTRAVVSEPLLAALQRERVQATESLALGVFLGLPISVGCLVGAALWPEGRSLLIASAVVIPMVSGQDAVRYVAFARQVPQVAAVLDGLWAVVLGGTLAVSVVGLWTPSPESLLLAWGVAGAAPALAYVLAGRVGEPARIASNAVNLLRGLWPDSRHYLGQYLGSYASTFAAFALAPLVMGPTQVGAVRGGLFLLSAVNLPTTAAIAHFVPVLASGRHSPSQARRVVYGISGAICAVALVNALVFWLGPDALGRAVLGDTWAGARDLLWLSALASLVNASTVGMTVMVRARREARRLTALRYALAVPTPAAALGLALLLDASARGFLIGLIVVSALGSIGTWWVYRVPDPASAAKEDLWVANA